MSFHSLIAVRSVNRNCTFKSIGLMKTLLELEQNSYCLVLIPPLVPQQTTPPLPPPPPPHVPPPLHSTAPCRACSIKDAATAAAPCDSATAHVSQTDLTGSPDKKAGMLFLPAPAHPRGWTGKQAELGEPAPVWLRGNTRPLRPVNAGTF